VKNARVALVFAAFCVAETLTSWRGLGKIPVRHSLIELPVYLFIVVVYAKLIAVFRCYRERFIVGIAMASLAIGLVAAYAPSVVGPFAHSVGLGQFVLYSLALAISLSMVLEAVRSPRVQAGNTHVLVPPRLLALCALIITALLVGALWYFVPWR
jgi:hypothetical protein